MEHFEARQQGESSFDSFTMDEDQVELQQELPTQLQLPESLFNTNPFDPYELYRDNEFEDLLLRQPELIDSYIKEYQSFNVKKFSKDVLTNDYMKKFDHLFPNLKNSARKHMIKVFLETHPSFRTMDPQLLWQRINYFYGAYGKKANKIKVREHPITKMRQRIAQVEEEQQIEQVYE